MVKERKLQQQEAMNMKTGVFNNKEKMKVHTKK
jgi:hypothetical protein